MKTGWRGYFIITVLLVLVSAPSGAEGPAELRSRLDRADQRFKSGDFEAARKEYEQATRADPGSIPAWRGLGWSLWNLNQKDAAIKIWTDLLKVRPNEPALLAALAQAYEQNRDWSRALSYYDQVIKIESGNREAHFGRARVYRAQNNLAAAETEARAMLDRWPGDVDAQATLAAIYVETGRLREARDVFRKLAVQKPDPKYQRTLGDLAAKLGDTGEAITYYRRSLQAEPEDRRTVIGLAHMLAREHRYKEAANTIEPYLAAHPDDDGLREELSGFATSAGVSETAESELRQLIRKYPQDVKWKVKLAQMFHRTGKNEEAVATAKEILAGDPQNVDALTLLANDAYFGGRDQEAIDWFLRLAKIEPKNPNHWLQIARIHFSRGDKARDQGRRDDAKPDFERALQAFQRAREVDPTNPDADLGIISALSLQGRSKETIPIAQQLLAKDPVLIRARRALYDAYYDTDDYKRAEETMDVLRKESPNNIRLERDYAALLFSQGRKKEAIELLDNDLHQPVRPNVPVLLYHGVSPNPRESAISAETFRDQMKALQREGYRPIDVRQLADFLDGRATLPPKPVLITFDDARSDSFRNADPVLREVGFKATMFVPVGEIGQHGAFTAPWNTLQEMQQSGRWDMQCHAYMAHRTVPIDAEGRRAAFLSARMWLADQGRPETDQEITARLDNDYAQCKEILSHEVSGANVIAFAYPFSDLGQDTLSNNPNAMRANRELAGKYFRLAFTEEFGEYVTKLKPRYNLPRFEVPRQMTGAELTQALRDNEPVYSMQERLGDLYAWSGKFDEALAVYDELERNRVDPSGILLRRGETHAWMGDYKSARPLIESAKALEPENRTFDEKLEALNLRAHPMVEGRGLYYSDNSDRSNSSVGPSARVFLTDRFSLAPRYGYSQFDQRNFSLSRIPSSEPSGSESSTTPAPTSSSTQTSATSGALATSPSSRAHLEAIGNEFEVEANYALDWLSGISLSGGAASFENRSNPRILSDNPAVVPLASGMVTTELGDQADVAVGGTHSYVSTAGAIIDELTFSGSTVRGRWRPAEWFTMTGRHIFTYYSDQNRRNTVIADALTRIWEIPNVQVGYQFTFDDTLHDNPFIYTPHQLNAHEGVVQLQIEKEPYLTVGSRGALGVGREKGGNAEVQGSVTGELQIHLSQRFGLFGNGGRFQAAKFKSAQGTGGLFFRF